MKLSRLQIFAPVPFAALLITLVFRPIAARQATGVLGSPSTTTTCREDSR